MPNKDTATLYFRAIPRPLKDKFKAYCARRGESMNATIMRMMREAVLEDRDAERYHQEQNENNNEI